MRNKKSVLMTSKVNYGYFSGVGGIAGNHQKPPPTTAVFLFLGTSATVVWHHYPPNHPPRIHHISHRAIYPIHHSHTTSNP